MAVEAPQGTLNKRCRQCVISRIARLRGTHYLLKKNGLGLCETVASAKIVAKIVNFKLTNGVLETRDLQDLV